MSDDFSLDPRKFAAVVYDDGVAVDDLLLVFARDLGSEGVRVGGVVQVPRRAPGCGPEAPLQLRDLATDEVFPICQDLGGGPADCCLDPTKLRQAAERIRSAIELSDLVFVSRFGKEEARGKGFRDELARAALCGMPVLTAVHRGRVDNWLAFTDGVGTLLDARLWVLKDWWNEIATKTRVAA
jgi:molybdate transport system ATP-binding protein